MIKTEFNLTEKVTLVPVSGNTDVRIQSTGRYDLFYKPVKEDNRPRYSTICTKGNTSLVKSRAGQITYLKIRLPTEQLTVKVLRKEFNDFIKYYQEIQEPHQTSPWGGF